MTKNQRFLRKAGLCLCLLPALWMSGCAISKPAGGYRTYRLIVTVLPGSDPLVLPAECGQITPNSATDLATKPRRFTFKIRLSNADQLADLRSRLNAAGVVVEEMSPALN